MIEAISLSAGYSGQPVLTDLTLTIPAGKVTVIVGPNGCGKSTLLRTLAGIHPPSGGTIRIAGQDAGTLSSRQMAQTVAYLAQSRQVPEITALRLVLHGRFPYLSYPRRYRREDMDIARACLERMGIGHLAHRPMNTLSGGQRQKVYIAMALAQDTPVVLMDEPTTFLDISHQMQTMEHARFLAGSGKTVVLVLHDLAMALQTADELIVMAEGRVVEQGKPQAVFSTGCLSDVFGIGVNRVETPDGWQYYYKNKERR